MRGGSRPPSRVRSHRPTVAIGACPADSTVAHHRPAIRCLPPMASGAGDGPMRAHERERRLLVMVEVHDLHPLRRLVAARAIRPAIAGEASTVRIRMAPRAGGGPPRQGYGPAFTGMA